MNPTSKEKKIQQVFNYFAQFSYPPLLEEIHLFYQGSITKEELQKELALLIRHKRVIEDNKSKNRYAKIDDKKFFDLFIIREAISQSKRDKVKSYLRWLEKSDTILFVGISGSVSMMNAADQDDIDLFIITRKNRLWTARLYAVIVALVMGIKRKRNVKIAKDSACLNLFFDEQELQVPKRKQTEYVAHEVLQLKPVVNKEQVYERFLQANTWVTSLFPQAAKKIPAHQIELMSAPDSSPVFTWFEQIAQWFQMLFIQRHRTTEYLTGTQLWFFPDDFEKKVRR